MRGRRAAESPVQLFPFLAVLMSALGALCLLLLAMTRQAQLSRDLEATRRRCAPLPAPYVAAALAPLPELVELEPLPPLPDRPVAPKTETPIPELLEIADPRPEALTERDRLRQELARMRAQTPTADEKGSERLARFADQIAALREKLRRLEDEERRQESLRNQRFAELEALKEEKGRAQRRSDHVENRYAIVPYTGPNGTTRRPIYLEVRGDGITLQPEGVVLSAELFQGLEASTNPLLDLVQAIVSELRIDGENGTPYPLLIVRPDGIAGYYVAQRALARASVPVGYELVSDEVELAYPEPDPKLRAIAEAVVRAAKLRMAELVSLSRTRGHGGEGRGGPGGVADARGGSLGRGSPAGDDGSGGGLDFSADSGRGTGSGRGDSLGESFAAGGERGVGGSEDAPGAGRSRGPSGPRGHLHSSAEGGGVPGGSSTGASPPGAPVLGEGDSASLASIRRIVSEFQSGPAGRIGTGAESPSRSESGSPGVALGPPERISGPESGSIGGENSEGRASMGVEGDDGRWEGGVGPSRSPGADRATLEPQPRPGGPPPQGSSMGRGVAGGTTSIGERTSEGASAGGASERTGSTRPARTGSPNPGSTGGDAAQGDPSASGSSSSPGSSLRPGSRGASGGDGAPFLLGSPGVSMTFPGPDRAADARGAKQSPPPKPNFNDMVFTPPANDVEGDWVDPEFSDPHERGGPRGSLLASAGLPLARRPLRREVVVECRGDRLVLHPTGQIVPIAEDGAGPAAAEEVYRHVVEAARHWGSPGPLHRWQPVVVFFVRPDGLANYYRLREGLLFTRLEFDRRLIDDDLLLEFPRWTPAPTGAARPTKRIR